MAETVTIVLSNYNHGRYLPESLKNISEQTRPADKILVIDDGSTDNSVQVISNFEAQYSNIRMIRNLTNIGLQASIEKIMPLVVTDCMVWSASDDVLLPDFLEKSMAALERHPEAGMCFSELTVLKGDTGVVQRFATEPSVAHIYDLRDLPEYIDQATVCARMRRSYFPPTSNSVVVRMWALKSVGYFRPELEWHSDWLAYNAVAVKYGSCVIAETLAHIREREDSYSAEGRRDPNQQRRVLDAMLDVIAEPGFEDVKATLEKYPSYYTVWGAEILPNMRRRPAFWRTYLNFRYWLLREKNRASGLSWKRWLLSKIPLIRIGIFSRPVAPPQPVSLINQLRAEYEEMRTQRESARHQRDLLNGHLLAMQTQRDNAVSQSTSMQQHMQGRHDEVANKYETARTKAVELSSQFEKISREFETAVSSTELTEQKLGASERDLLNLQATFEANAEAWREEKEAFQAAITEGVDAIDSREVCIEELGSSIKLLSNDLHDAKISLEEFRCDPVWAQTTDDLVAERDALQRALGESQADAAAAEAREASLTDQASALIAERDNIQSVVTELEARANLLDDELDDEKADLFGQVDALTAERDTFRGELGTAQQKLAVLQELRDELTATQTLCNSLRDQITKIKIPSILIATMPKSGTYYISEYLSKGLLVEKSIVSNQYFPNDVIYQKRMIEFAEGSYVSEDHFDGAEINLRHLEVVTDRIVVHVRDPRQATLSYIHFINSDFFRNNEQFTKKFVYPVLPNEFYEMSLKQQIDWGIENWLPLLIDWVKSWIRAEKTSSLTIRFTTFEFMVEDEIAFFEDIVSFFDIPKERFRVPKLVKNEAVHFRAGKTDEWRDVLTTDQIARANKLLPDNLCRRFGWAHSKVSVAASAVKTANVR
jgi:glycosyltransferase involved in cell wall biosynthesis/uncharacterized coiled-coil DUF342 family protein